MRQSSIAQWLTGSSNTSEQEPNRVQINTAPTWESSDTHKIALPCANGTDPDPRTRNPPTEYAHNQALKPLPANVTISPCTDVYIKSFHRLNALLLPIQYPDAFYAETLDDQVIASVTRVALWTPSDALREHNSVVNSLPATAHGDTKVVAGIRCRLLACPPHKPIAPEPNLYISTIGTLAAFRELSLASHLLERIFKIAVEEYGLSTVYAHVWEANEEALQWYIRRGFTILHKEVGYYQKLAPKTDAWLIKRDIG